MSSQLGDQILEALHRRDPPAAFVTEVAATIRPAPRPAQIEDALSGLDEAGRVLVMQHAAPDIHLESIDLRVVARVPGEGAEHTALEAAEAVWDGWLRTFLATHRCE